MSGSEGLRQGRAAVSRIFRDESKLRAFVEQTKAARINLEACDFRQVESFVRELAPPAGTLPARGGRAVIGYQDMHDDELAVLQEHFRQELKGAKARYSDLFN